MSFSPTTSYAAAKLSSVQNKIFTSSANVLPHKTVIIGSYSATDKTGITENLPYLILSPEHAGSLFGFGDMIHRLALANDAGANGIETWVIPQDHDGGTAATGEVTFTVATTTSFAGTLHLYIHGDYVPVTIASSIDSNAVATAVVAAINANTSLNVTAAVNGTLANQVDLTSKTLGPWGDDVSIDFDLAFGQESHSEVTPSVTTPMGGGATLPDIQDALDAMGLGDDQNEKHFTELVHGYGQDSTTLTKISNYNGTGDGFLGNYAKTVARPFRSRIGNVDEETGTELGDLIDFAEARKETDRTNGITCVPGSQTHPQEIAAVHLGVMAATSNVRAEEGYIDKLLPGVWPGPGGSGRWTADYDNVDLAAKAGLSPTKVKNGVVYIQDSLTFYNPEAIPIENNGYKSDRNNSITQNILDSQKVYFETERWTGVTIVADATKVGNTTSREKVVDRETVVDALGSLVTRWEENAWIYDAAYTIGRLNSEPDLVTIRSDARGFLITIPVIYSGENAIMDVKTYFDVSIRVLG